ncbi:MAG: hypothetical protein NTW87_06025 [Planctomycetota bacterium]|nr:hypothetical protein [Planctomycetota bacterium]
MKKPEIEPLGFMNEQFRRYGCEDHEFAWRLKNTGIHAEYLESAVAFHYEDSNQEDPIAGFERKCYTMTRYSLPLLATLAPEFLNESWMRFLQPVEGTDAWQLKLAKGFWRLAVNRFVASPLRSFLKWTDGVPWLYCPLLYRYVFAFAMLVGCDDQQKTDHGNEHSWL